MILWEEYYWFQVAIKSTCLSFPFASTFWEGSDYNETVERVAEFWTKANIPKGHKQEHWKFIWKISLKKNESRQYEKQAANENGFKECFDDLFDIAHINALRHSSW